MVRLSRDGASHHVDDSQCLDAVRLALAQRFQAVRRLTGLADDDRQSIRCNGASAIPELRGDFDTDRDVGQVFKDILSDHADVVGGTASDDEDVVDRLDVIRGHAGRGEVDLVLVVGDGMDGVLDGLRLFVELLEHEVLVSAAFGRFRVPGDLGQVLDQRLAVDVVELDAALFQAGHLHIVDVIDFSRMVQNGGDVGGDVRTLPLFADNHRAAVAGAEDLAGIICEHETQRIGTAHTQDGTGNGAQRAFAVFLIVIVDELDHDFRIRLGIELVPLTLQFLDQLFIILDDAVVHADDRVVIRVVRVGIGLRGRTVGRPAGVADAAGADDRLDRSDLLLEVGDPSLFLDGDGRILSIANGNTGGVIAAVLQFGQAFEQDRSSLFRSDITDDSTHRKTS